MQIVEDKFAYKFLSISLLIFGSINLLLSLGPIIVYKGSETATYNAYQMLTWFSSSMPEGIWLAIMICIMLIMFYIITTYGIYTLMFKKNIALNRHINILKRGTNIYFILILSLSMALYITVDTMHFRLSGISYELPYKGWGLSALLWVNLLLSPLHRILLQIIQDRVTKQNIS